MTAPPRMLEYVLGLTAFAAGSVDVISFAKLGGTLASAMTGNLALTGLYLSRGSFHAAAGSIIALCAFVIGAAVASLLTRTRDRGKSVNLLLGLEVALLAGFVALWLASGQRGAAQAGLISLLAVSMGMQSIIGKKIDLSSIPTIVFTSTLINIVIALTTMLATGRLVLERDTGRQIACALAYFAGAFGAGFLIYLHSAWMIAMPLTAAALAWLASAPRRGEPKNQTRA